MVPIGVVVYAVVYLGTWGRRYAQISEIEVCFVCALPVKKAVMGNINDGCENVLNIVMDGLGG